MDEENSSGKYIWYHDLKWDKHDLEKVIQISLSDGKRIEFKMNSLEELQGIINKLEGSL